MNGVAVVHRISCTAIEPRHGQGGTARQGPRQNARQIRQRFLTDTSIQEALPEFSHPFSINLSKWSLALLD
jgi:hypothetical protein